MGDPRHMEGKQRYHDLSRQHRQNETAGQVDVSTRFEVHMMGIPDTCRDNRHITICQKKHRQNDPAGQVDIRAIVESL